MKLGKFFGIDVTVHWSILIALAWFSLRGFFGPPLISVIITMILFAIVLMHEFGHALMAKAVGYRADKINLNVMGGIAFVDDEKKPENIKWWKVFFMIAAGPAVNVVIAIVMTVLGPILGFDDLRGFMGGTADRTTLATYGVVAHIWYFVYLINMSLLIFNMIPSYPLDGGQLLHSMLWGFLKLIRVKRAQSVSGMACSALGLFLALLLLALGVIMVDFVLLFIAIFLSLVALASFVKFKEEYNGKKILTN